MKLPRSYGKAPWAIASFIAIPLLFTSLMCSTLAQEKPRLVQWTGCTSVCTTWHEPSSAMEARIWLWALLPPVLLSLVGWLCMRIPQGWYVACVAGIVEAVAVVHKLDIWTKHHIARFPNGVDLIPSSNAQSNIYDPGEWENLARQTALSLEHWTIGVAVASIVVMALLQAKRRWFARRSLLADSGGTLEGVHAPDATGASVPSD